MSPDFPEMPLARRPERFRLDLASIFRFPIVDGDGLLDRVLIVISGFHLIYIFMSRYF